MKIRWKQINWSEKLSLSQVPDVKNLIKLHVPWVSHEFNDFGGQ